MPLTSDQDEATDADDLSGGTHHKVKVPDEQVVRSRNIESGMMLTRDVYTDNGQLLFPSKTILDESDIKKLKKFGKRSVHVRDYETKWVDEAEYQELPASAERIETKKIPPVELNDAEDEEQFNRANEFIDETGSIPKIRDFVNTLMERADYPEIEGVEEEFQEVRDQTLDVEDELEYLLAQLSKIDDDDVRKKILSELYDFMGDGRNIQDDSDIPESMEVALERFSDGKQSIKNKLQNLLYQSPEIIQAMNDSDIPTASVGFDGSNESSEGESDGREISLDNHDNAEKMMKTILESTDGDLTDELLSTIIESLGLDDLDAGDLDQFLGEPGDDLNKSTDANIDLETDEIKKIKNKLEESDVPVVAGPSDRILDAFHLIENGEWEKGIKTFSECFKQSKNDQYLQRGFEQYQDRSSELLDEWDDLLKTLEEQFSDVSEGTGLSAEFDLMPRDLEGDIDGEVMNTKVQHNLEEVIDDRLDLVLEFWDELNEVLPDFLNSTDEQTRDQILEIFQQKSNELVKKQLKGHLEDSLNEKMTTEGKTESKRDIMLKDAVEENDWDAIKNLNGLPDEALEKIKELFRRPTDPNKWQKKLFNQHEAIFKDLVYGLNVNHQAIKDYLRQIDKVLEKESLFLLFLQPPSVKHYHLVHAYNSTLLSIVMARELDFPEKAKETIICASTLADVGLTMIPNSFYLEEGDLSERADQEITKHPIYSRKVASFIFGSNHTVSNLVGEHHERLDGSGYPEAKNESELSPLSSVISCADVYTAMVENRIYRDKRMPDEAIHHLKQNSDAYNQRLVRVIARVIGIFPDGTLVKLSNNKLALVNEQTEEAPNPRVYVLTDEHRNRLDKPERMDLSKERGLTAQAALRTGVTI